MIGQTLSHYDILGKVGAGGMGVVYRAHDHQLGRDVALKVLPAGMLANEAARKNFRKEAFALAKLNHPNIETVYEFSSQGDVDFLAMELIPGESLHEKLKEGPLASNVFDSLAVQIAEGLAAAHDQGIIHRDIKPANLMVTPDARLKILDFGLAKLLHPSISIDLTLSTSDESRAIAGTVPYMSPEQLRGLPVDPRNDIYAVGAVLYEMATGRRPFPQTQQADLVDAILHQTPPRPRSLNPLVPAGTEIIIVKAMERDASKRYQTARDLRADLLADSSKTETLTRAQTGGALGRPLILGKCIALAIILAIGVVLGLNIAGLRDRIFRRPLPDAMRAEAAAASAPIHVRPSIAVLGFKNVSGRADESWLADGLAETMDSELSAGEQLRIIPGESVTRMKTELLLSDADSYSSDTLAKIRRNLGTDYVVEGSFIALGAHSSGQIRVDVKLQDTRSGEMIASVIETGQESNLNALFAKAGADLRVKLGVSSPSAAEESAAQASLPSNPDAARYYSEGLVLLHKYDALAARVPLQEAIAVEPSFALSHLALSSAWSQLGYAAKARDESKIAFDLSKNLSREERLVVEAVYREVQSDWPGAAEDYRTLFGYFPDNLNYGLRLAYDQTASGKAQDGLATCEALRKLPPPWGDDPSIDNCAGNAAEKLGNFKLEQKVAATAAEKAKARGTRVLQANALKEECWATHRLGDPTQAMQLCTEARQIYEQVGYTNAVAGILINIGSIQTSVGDQDGAKASYLTAETTSRRAGNLAMLPVVYNNLGNIYFGHGDLHEAEKYLTAAEAGYRETGNDRGLCIALENHANIFEKRGDLATAEKLQMESLGIAKRIGNSEQVAHLLGNLAGVHYEQGKLALAKQEVDASQAINNKIATKRALSLDFLIQGMLQEAADHLKEARQQFEQSLALRNEMGGKGEAAETAMELGALDLEEGATAKAEAAARNSLEEFRKEKQLEEEVTASALLVLALVDEGKTAEAQKEADNAAPLVAACQTRETIVEYSIVHARLLAALHHSSSAITSLAATITETHKFGIVPDEFEARLALGEIEMKSGKTAAGRVRLAALQKDATANGFLLLAGKAAEASK